MLELGGSDPYIVLDRSNLDQAVKNSAFARLQNNGQSCIASKRFIVHESVYEDFYKGMKEAFSSVKIGDPLDKNVFLGPLSSADQKQIVTEQVEKLHSLGSVEELASGMEGNLSRRQSLGLTPCSTKKYLDQWPYLRSSGQKGVIKLANETPYGLGASIWGDPQRAEKLVPSIDAGLGIH